ncbi:hypothetical protein LCGC14_1133870 [marine sediment metagenome]|uniref:Uncharacterized protein n=1 Tax=marine sediment metagenome TaxID=412755 RepID=A0A0F9PIK7_9ZZZZ
MITSYRNKSNLITYWNFYSAKLYYFINKMSFLYNQFYQFSRLTIFIGFNIYIKYLKLLEIETNHVSNV